MNKYFFKFFFWCFFSLSVFSEEISGIAIKTGGGNLVVKTDTGEEMTILIGKKETAFYPNNYRVLKGDKINVSYKLVKGTKKNKGTMQSVALIIEMVSKGDMHIESPIICSIKKVGKKMDKGHIM